MTREELHEVIEGAVDTYKAVNHATSTTDLVLDVFGVLGLVKATFMATIEEEVAAFKKERGHR